jgi:hypothetical protein
MRNDKLRASGWVVMHEGRSENNASNFFSENAVAITIKLARMIQTSLAIMKLSFHKVSVIFNTLWPTLSKTLYTSVVKHPAMTSEHITKTSFQFTVICKMAFTQCILSGPNRWLSDGASVGCGQVGEE